LSKKIAESEGQEETFFRKLGIPLLGIQAVRNAIELNRDTGNTVCIVGEAGIGKTHITKQVGAVRVPRKPFTWRGVEWTKSVPVIPFYLAHLQPEDLSVPYPSRAKQSDMIARSSQLAQLADFVRDHATETGEGHDLARQIADILEGQITDIAKNVAFMDERTKKNGTMEFLINKELFNLPPEGILFFDEYNRADRGVVKSFFTLVEDGEVHGIRIIHPGIQIIAAMNPSDGQYSVNEAEKDPAIKRRLCFLAMSYNVGSWLNYARGKFHDLVVEYIEANNSALYDAKLRLASKVYPCPATWEKVSKLLCAAEEANIPFSSDGVEACICGHVGESVGSQFTAYIKDKSTVIPPSDILNKYTDKSSVRKKVQTLVDNMRFDVLSELCGNIATLLLSSQPDPQTIAAKLAVFLGDLPSDTATAFIVQKLRTASEGVSDAAAYLTTLSKVLSTQPPYQRHIKAITDALAKARKEAGRADPL
jgi:MoxR-like ATPase